MIVCERVWFGLVLSTTMASVSSSTAHPPTHTNSPPSSTSILFARGILARLQIWPALSLAIANNWGGPGASSKRAWLAGELLDAFVAPPPGEPAVPDAEYVEAMLLQVMADEFECELEDESAWDVARDIVRCWDALQRDPKEAEAAVLSLEKRADGAKGRTVQAQQVPGAEDQDWDSDEDGSGSDDEDVEMDEAPQLLEPAGSKPKQEPVVDDDGFTLVQGKGKGKK